jgi:cell division protein FtsI/penicillin-binding protein 2
MESNLRDDRRDFRCEDMGYGVAHSQNAIMGKLAFQKLEPALLEAEARAFGWVDPLKHLGGTFGELEMPPARDLAFAKTAAGFTGTRLSVVGGAVVAATFAASGERPTPRIVASIGGIDVTPPAATRTITAAHAKAVAQMMIGTCENGSAAKTFRRGRRDGKVSVAGKTGTLTRSKPFYMEHSWFVGFAPATRPEIVVSVLLGNPENWQLRGHEAARRLIDRALQPATARGEDRARSVTVEKRNQW